MMLTEYFQALGLIAERVNISWLLVAGVFVRMSAVAFLAPALGELAVPPRVRLAAAAALTLIVAPTVVFEKQDALNPAQLAAIFFGEVAAGLLIGFSLRLAIFVLQILGAIIAPIISLSQLFGAGLDHDQESPVSTILIIAGLALACAGGLHIELAAAMSATFQVFAFGGFIPAGDAAEFTVSQTGRVLALALGLAAPFVILGFIYSIALAAVNRAMPQMAAIFVGAPAIIFAGLVLIAGSASIILMRWSDVMARLIAEPLSGLP
ncbi:MAG: flagellar biosynthetic protein FliR [Parvularculaceae bacterium]